MPEYDAKSFFLFNQATGEERAFSVSWVFEKNVFVKVTPLSKELVAQVVAFLNPRNQPELHQPGSESHAFVLIYGRNGRAVGLQYVSEYSIIPEKKIDAVRQVSVSNGNFENCLRFDFEATSSFNNDRVYFSHDLSSSKIYGQANISGGTPYRCRVLALLLPAYHEYGNSGIPTKDDFKLLGLTYALDEPGKLLLRSVHLEK